jgi:hypothetical protein
MIGNCLDQKNQHSPCFHCELLLEKQNIDNVMKSGGSYKALELKYHPDKNPEICKIVCTEAMFILNKTRRRGRRNDYQMMLKLLL